MKNHAFTLVELLVVILIIAVLAGVVFAQYQKSILKSRFSTLVPIAKALNDGQEMFLLSHGKYADKLENLDVEIASGASGNTANINGNIITLGANNRHTYIKVTKENFDNNLIMFQQESRYFPGEIHCEAKTGKILANWLCKVALNGKEVSGANADRSLTEGYTDYVINGAENGFFPKDWVDVKGNDSEKLDLMPGDTCTGTTENSGCYSINFSNGSVCYGEGNNTCSRGNYSNATCIGNVQVSCGGNFSNNSQCIGDAYVACRRSTFTNNSVCIGNVGYGPCHGGNFTNSTCIGNSEGACSSKDGYYPTYTDSTCVGNGKGSCMGGTFQENSVCEGNHSQACVGSTFSGNSICYANEEGSCGDYDHYGSITPSTYEGNACCKGALCPGYAPKCDCAIDSSTGQHALSC